MRTELVLSSAKGTRKNYLPSLDEGDRELIDSFFSEASSEEQEIPSNLRIQKPNEENSLIVSKTASINLMAIETHLIRLTGRRIQEAESNPCWMNPDLLLVAQMELAFLEAKECVFFFSEADTWSRVNRQNSKGFSTAELFSIFQVV